MMKNLKSIFLAAALALTTAAGLTAGQTIIFPDTAQAGVISKVKGAAKSVGSAAKTVGKGVATVGKRAGVGVARNVKRGAVSVGRVAARTPVVKGVKNFGKSVKVAASKVKKAIGR